MKAKIKDLSVRLQTAIRRNPVEMVLSLLFCVLGCVSFESEIVWLRELWPCFPFLFLTTYTLHQYIQKKYMRLIYYLSVFFFIPFIWITFEIWSARYLVTLVVIQLVYLASCWKKSNELFIQFAIRYVRSVLCAWMLSTIAWALFISIYLSIRYIFEIWATEESRLLTYAAAIAYLGLFPLLFLLFSQDSKEKEWGNNRLFDVLLNYVLSPALLIYAVILYLYFIKIVVLGSLPKGAVAYIVVSFTSATFILKGCQILLTRRYYDWFYKQASLVVLPALVMYWVGTCYRIYEYGFTEPRVYLVVVGLILTIIMGLFFFKRSGHYLYAASVAIVLLSVVTYIPGMTAKDIEIASQLARGNYPPREEQGVTCSDYAVIKNNLSVDISGFRSLQSVDNYDMQHDNMWISQENDSLCLYEGKKELYRERLDVLLRNQLTKAGLSPADTIPVSAYPALLRLEMDSATLIFNSMMLYRHSTYKITNLDAGYYLKK